MADTTEQPTPETEPTTNEVPTEEKKEEDATEENSKKEEEVPPTVTEQQQQQQPHDDEVEAVQVEVNISKDLFSFFVSYHDQQRHNV